MRNHKISYLLSYDYVYFFKKLFGVIIIPFMLYRSKKQRKEEKNDSSKACRFMSS